MASSSISIFWMWVFFLCFALLGSVVWSIKQRFYLSMSWRGIVCSNLPAVVMLASFYALALHMYVSLGGWPKSIGENGFSPSLLWHANLTCGYFLVVVLGMIFAWPAALVVCSLVAGWRPYMAHLGLIGISVILCLALMYIGPSGFLYWWRD